ASCRNRHGDIDGARADAAQAYRLAACDGPPFVYHAGMRRALQMLDECGTYVPPTRARLDPQWRKKLDDLEREERELERAIEKIRTGDFVLDAQPTFEEAMATIEETVVLREASERDRAWLEEVTGSRAAIKVPLAKEMERSGITLESFRQVFEESEHRSFIVI